VAQFPDIAPPQVGVTAFQAAANAEAVEESAGRIVESAAKGGSHRLSVSCDVGPDPEATAVNLQNRGSRAPSRRPPEVRQAGVRVKKKSSAILQLVAIHAPQGGYDALFQRLRQTARGAAAAGRTGAALDRRAACGARVWRRRDAGG
jgi:multidrug efflux pump subunit AcrB